MLSKENTFVFTLSFDVLFWGGGGYLFVLFMVYVSVCMSISIEIYSWVST